jgi:uncharacterized protein with PIN domain
MALCPYCKKELKGSTIKSEEMKPNMLQLKREMFSCPHCNSILGFASNS